jgi:hypothetical protein
MRDMEPTLVAVDLRRHLGEALGDDEANVINNAIFCGHPSVAVLGGLSLASLRGVSLPSSVLEHIRIDFNWSEDEREELEGYIASLPHAA